MQLQKMNQNQNVKPPLVADQRSEYGGFGLVMVVRCAASECPPSAVCLGSHRGGVRWRPPHSLRVDASVCPTPLRETGLTMKSFSATPKDIKKELILIDADGVVLAAWPPAWPTSCAASTRRPTPRTWIAAITS